jgi:hypothetical protein
MNRNKIVVVHHSADFDGIFCREIARKFLPEAKLIGWDFGDPSVEIDPDCETLYVMDLPCDRLFGFTWDKEVHDHRFFKGQLIWIDHHKTSIETHPEKMPGYRIDGVAACRLAWQWFSVDEHNAQNRTNEALQLGLPNKQNFINREVPEPWAVRLAGEYDIWDKRDDAAELFQSGLRSQELTPGVWAELLDQGNNLQVSNLLLQGTFVQFAQREADKSTVKYRSFRAKFEGLNFLCLNTPRCNSLTFQSAVKPFDDALMGLFYDGRKWKVSMYGVPHKPEVDLSEIAKRRGGGGHKQACGFETADNVLKLLEVM